MDGVHTGQLCRVQSGAGRTGVHLEDNTQGQHVWIHAPPAPMLGGEVHSLLYQRWNLAGRRGKNSRERARHTLHQKTGMPGPAPLPCHLPGPRRGSHPQEAVMQKSATVFAHVSKVRNYQPWSPGI